MLEPLASGEAVLEEDEKGLGVALVDIGGGTTDIAIFTEGAVAHTSVIPIGGHQLTSDIAFGLRTPPHEAEKIKIRAGCALASMVGEDETLEVASVGGRAPRILSRHAAVPRHHPAAHRGDLLVREGRDRAPRLRRSAGLGRRDHRRRHAAARHDRAGRGDPGHPRAPRRCPKGVGGLAEVVRSPTFSTAVGLVHYGFCLFRPTIFPSVARMTFPYMGIFGVVSFRLLAPIPPPGTFNADLN